MGKPTMWFSNRSCTSTEDGFGFIKLRNCTIRVAKTKALISFAVTAKLICAFVFAYADCWFYHVAAQLSFSGLICDILHLIPGPIYLPLCNTD